LYVEVVAVFGILAVAIIRMKKTEALLRLSLARFHLNPKYMGMVCLQARVILCHLTIFVAQVKNDNVTKFAHVQVVVNST